MLRPVDEKLLREVANSLRTRQRPPTQVELQDALGMKSQSYLTYVLNRLETNGYIERSKALKGKSRNLQLTEKGWGVVAHQNVPVLGDIAAGLPIEAIQLPGEYLPVMWFIAQKGNFVLRVRGDSMTGAAILDGDYVLIRQQAHAERGDIVAALIEGWDTEATVKGYYPLPDGAEFRPANPAYPPIRVVEGRDTWRILGVVVAVLREGDPVKMPEEAVEV